MGEPFDIRECCNCRGSMTTPSGRDANLLCPHCGCAHHTFVCDQSNHSLVYERLKDAKPAVERASEVAGG